MHPKTRLASHKPQENFTYVPQADSVPQIDREGAKWEKQVKRNMKSKLVSITKKQREMVRAFQTGGWLVHEPVLEAELDIMQREPGQFRFANLAEIDVRCLRQYVETALAAHCTGRVQVATQAAAPLSTRAQAYASALSQSQPVTSGQDPSQVLATSQELPAQKSKSADEVFAELAELDMEAIL